MNPEKDRMDRSDRLVQRDRFINVSFLERRYNLHPEILVIFFEESGCTSPKGKGPNRSGLGIMENVQCKPVKLFREAGTVALNS